MRICYFGDYDPRYARNRVLLRGLHQAGAVVCEANTQKKGWVRYWDLFRRMQVVGPCDAVIIGYSDSRLMVPFAWLITRKPLIWDAFYSVYESWVFDKKIVHPQSFQALYYWLLEWLCVRLAKKTLLDTNAHIMYFTRVFHARRDRFVRVLIGADDSVFHPTSL